MTSMNQDQKKDIDPDQTDIPQPLEAKEGGEYFIDETNEASFASHLQDASSEGPKTATQEHLRAEIARLEQEMLDQKDKMMRALAEAENTRRRAVKDREDSVKYAVTSFAKDLLGFSDNFLRALDSIPEDVKNSDDVRMQNVISGLNAMAKEFQSVFERHKITKIIPLDEMFNPNFHEVMFEAPLPGKAKGIIIEVIEPGYMLHDRLLRPARVGIAKGDDGVQPPEAGQTIDTQA